MVVDDLLATGGTTAAVFKLIEKLGGKVIGASFIIELEFLNPREKLEGYDVFSLVQYNQYRVLRIEYRVKLAQCVHRLAYTFSQLVNWLPGQLVDELISNQLTSKLDN